MAYVAIVANRWFLVVDGKQGKEYDGIVNPTFSPDSRHLVYFARKGKKWLVVVDGKEGKEYEGRIRRARIIFDSSDSFHYLAIKDKNIYLVYNKIEQIR